VTSQANEERTSAASATTNASEEQPGTAGVLQTLRETPVSARFALLGVLINQFGAFLQFFLVLYLTARGFSTGQAGFALGAYSAGAIVGTLFGGGLTDRLGPRSTLVLSLSAAAVLTLAVTVLHPFAAIVAVVVVAGAMTQATRPAISALLFGLAPESRRVMTFAMYRTALNTGQIAGPLVAVWLSTISWNLVFYFDAATTLGYCAIAALLLPADRPARDADQESAADSTAARRSYLGMLRDHRYLAYLVLMLANGLVHVQIFAVLPLQLKAEGYGTWAYGTVATVTAFMVVGLELLVTRTTQNWPTWIAIMSGWALLVVGRGAWGLPGGLTIYLLATIIAVVGQIIGGPAAFAYPAKAAPAGAMGRYIAAAHGMFGLGYTIGPVLGVLLWTSLGKGFWAVCVLFGIAMVPVGIWGLRPVHDGSLREAA
jgi:MFS family permease